LLHPEAERIAARYRVSLDEALAALRDAFAARPDLARRIRERHEREDVTRWRDYRDTVKACRKDIYYRLRRHYPRPESADEVLEEFETAAGAARTDHLRDLRERLLQTHVSTRERLEHLDEFHGWLFAHVGCPGSVLDLGCGLYPLCYPFDGRGGATEVFVAVDDDERSIWALKAFARILEGARLIPLQRSLTDPDWAAELPGPERFEVALMLKLVPLLDRRDPEAVAGLQGAPAERLVVTGSVRSMTRRRSVERRERAVLRRLIEQTGRRVVDEFRLPTEFGYLLE
jgi:16S rRNA (guanine(1405)-N(7))-methyltransferase